MCVCMCVRVCLCTYRVCVCIHLHLKLFAKTKIGTQGFYHIVQNVGGGKHWRNHFEVYLDGKILVN